MANKRAILPSRAFAQGELAALLLAAPADTAAPTAPAASGIAARSSELSALVAERRSQEFERNVAARELSALNARRAELLPRHSKMVLQAESLRRAQLASIDLDRQRRLRRERAELNVRIEDAAHTLSQLESGSGRLRLAIAKSEQAIASNEHASHQARAVLEQAQREAPPLAAYVQPLVHSLALGSCQFFLAPETEARAQAFRRNRQQVADHLLALCQEMTTGRFREQEVSAFAGGRGPLVGELSWGLLAIGDDERLRALYAAMMPAPMSHQIFAVFRAFLPALLRHAPDEALALALGAHRFSQGLRGALAEAAFCLLAGREEGFVTALKNVPVYGWRQGHPPGQAAFGLVSVAAAGLARLGAERGWRMPTKELMALAPADLWRAGR